MAVGGQGSGLGPGPACVLRACPLQSRRDNKTNNFLDLLSWTPFIFPQPQGRTDLVVGPERGSCTVTGGWATPAPLLPASCLPPLLPAFSPPRRACRCSFHPGPSRSRALLPPFRLSPLPLLFLCLSVSAASPPSPSLFLLPSLDHGSLSLVPTSPRPSTGRLSGASIPQCLPHPGRLAVLGDPAGAFPWDLLSSCCQGRGSWPAGAGGRCPPGESPELSLAPPGWERTGGSDSGLDHLSTP